MRDSECVSMSESNLCRKHRSQSQGIESNSTCKAEQTCHVGKIPFDIRPFGASDPICSKPVASLVSRLLNEDVLASLCGTIVTADRDLIGFDK